MASHNPRHGDSAADGRALTQRRRRLAAAYFFKRVAFGALLLLTILPAVPAARAQSGRNKQQQSKTSTGATRPKRVGGESQTQQPESTPAPRVPAGTVVLDEAAPAPPAPKVTPTPVADTAVDEEVGAEDVVRITSNLVTVPASVVDAQGHAVTDLKLEDFELRVDGQPRPISELSRSEVPVTLALLFDNSSSLSAAREFEKQAAIKFFRSVIRPIDRAALYSVDTEIKLVQPLTNSVPALVRTIEHFGKPEGATRLLDAVVEAATYLRPYPGRKVIVIVSDGEDTLSDAGFDDALRKALGADCQVYAVQTKQIEYVMLTGERANANLQALAAERRMQDLTSHTGGAVYTPLQTSDLDAAFAQISADLAQQYVLSYYPTDERSDGRFRTISVRVATRPNMRVRARRGYYPRRPNERFSFNTELPAPVQPTAGETSARETESSSSSSTTTPLNLASNNITPARTSGAQPAPSRRRGPSEAGDESDAGASAEAADVATTASEPSSQRSGSEIREPVIKTSKPQSQPAAASPISDNSIANERRAASAPAASDTAASKPAASKTAASNSAASNSPASDSAPLKSTATAADAAGKPVSGGVLNGKAVYLPMPQYPPAARNMHATGIVTVEVLLDVDGKVISARAADGHPLLRQAAVDAARLARFSPTFLSGKPVQVAGLITYRFNLRQ